jgi:hypothetical protein
MDAQNSLAQHPIYFKVVILADVVNELSTTATALLDCLPHYSRHKGEYREDDIGYAKKMSEIANIYGWCVVFESKNEAEAFQIQQSLRYKGIRILPFGHSLPSSPNQGIDSDSPQQQNSRIGQDRSIA